MIYIRASMTTSDRIPNLQDQPCLAIVYLESWTLTRTRLEYQQCPYSLWDLRKVTLPLTSAVNPA